MLWGFQPGPCRSISNGLTIHATGLQMKPIPWPSQMGHTAQAACPATPARKVVPCHRPTNCRGPSVKTKTLHQSISQNVQVWIIKLGINPMLGHVSGRLKPRPMPSAPVLCWAKWPAVGEATQPVMVAVEASNVAASSPAPQTKHPPSCQ